MSWRNVVQFSISPELPTEVTEVSKNGTSVASVTSVAGNTAQQAPKRRAAESPPNTDQSHPTKATQVTEVPKNRTSVTSVGKFGESEKQQKAADVLNWPRFVALCTAHGVTADDVQAMFTDQDISDLCEEPEHQLPKHAATVVGAIRRARSAHRVAPTVPDQQGQARTYRERVRCGRCTYFECNPQHPGTGLGSCTARTDVAMGIPARLIDCTHYQQRPRT